MCSYLEPGDRSVTLHNGSAVFAMSSDDAADGGKDRRYDGFGRHGEEDGMKWLGPGWKWRIYMLNWGPATCKRTTFLRRSVAGKTDEPEVDPRIPASIDRFVRTVIWCSAAERDVVFG